MGHLGRLKDQYRDLVDRLGRGHIGMPAAQDGRAEAARRELLELHFSPEEAALAAKMPIQPIGLESFAKRVGMSPRDLEAKLAPMCDRGVVIDLVHPRTGKVTYMLPPSINGFFEYSLMRKGPEVPTKHISELMHAYLDGDPAQARAAYGTNTSFSRIMTNETKIADDVPEVLEWERATGLLGSARKITVTQCFCRHKAEHVGEACDAPQDNCLSLNSGAEFVERHGLGRVIEKSEALEILARSRDAGLVQLADNVQKRPVFMCNCCGCCCDQLRAVSRWGLDAVNPSGFIPSCDTDRCTGCSKCARACPVGAIEMRPVLEAGRRKHALTPRIDEERCIGCGVCANACNQKHALTMTRGGKPRPVPATVTERVVRMAVERNNLADLLFDAGDGLGQRFLRDALSAILKLPPAQALVASDQLGSRFIRAAVERFGKGS